MKTLLLPLLSLLCSLALAIMDPKATPELLTSDNYYEKTAGKTVFVKFFSPKYVNHLEILSM